MQNGGCHSMSAYEATFTVTESRPSINCEKPCEEP